MGAIEAEIIGFATGTVTASGRLADARDRVAFVNITELDAGIGGVPGHAEFAAERDAARATMSS